jgi:enamine deaminase RidA (YjgF/YER057c/UK114 family)
MHDGPVQPPGWAAPRGYSNGYVVDGVLFIAGQIAWDAECRLVGEGDMGAQFAQALANVRAVLDAAACPPERVGRVTVYVTDKRAYLAATGAIGAAWRTHIGRHYPAMALVQVADLLEEGALVEIEATAVLRRETNEEMGSHAR